MSSRTVMTKGFADNDKNREILTTDSHAWIHCLLISKQTQLLPQEMACALYEGTSIAKLSNSSLTVTTINSVHSTDERHLKMWRELIGKTWIVNAVISILSTTV